MKTQIHLRLKLDKRLNFREDLKDKDHLKDKVAVNSKGIRMLKKMSNYLSWHSLVTLYKAFIPHHLEYVDIIYDKLNNEILQTLSSLTQSRSRII